MGSHTKNTLCFLKGEFAYISPVHPALDEPKSFLSFQKEAKAFLRQGPKLIAYDLHPDYQSTKYALGLPPATYRLSPIQHHHAHIASCMAENRLKNQKVIGVAFDGTGLGEDGTIWGAEFLLCNYQSYIRAAHLKEIALLGGEKAILEPWRLACLWLYRIYKDDFLRLNIDFIKKIPAKNWGILKKLYLSGFNFPLASSMGRFFDAAASIILAQKEARFEAELAIKLQKSAASWHRDDKPYNFKIISSKGRYVIDPSFILRQVVRDLGKRQAREKIAYKFHLTAAEMVLKVCLILRKKYGINRVVLSGGVFQNNLLLKKTLRILGDEGFSVFIHKNLSCSDSSLSLGQAVVANFSCKDSIAGRS
jgi:hydrogenase maturation protein HypF